MLLDTYELDGALQKLDSIIDEQPAEDVAETHEAAEKAGDFSHIAHVKMGEIDCRACHGDHAKTDRLPVYKENRLTGYSIDIWGRHISGYKKNTWDRMKMDDCSECHTQKGHEENNACFVCHK